MGGTESCFERKSDLNDKMLAAQNMTMKAFIPQSKTRCTHILLFSLPYNKSQTSLVRPSSSTSQHASCEDQLRRKMLEKIIRVDHAGEMGASFIYQGQMAVLKNTKSRELIQEMWDHEKAHLAKFEELLLEYQVRPTVLIPVWKLAGFTLGAGCSLLGEKGAMACTVAVTFSFLFSSSSVSLVSSVSSSLVSLGAGCSLLGEKGAMACTVAVTCHQHHHYSPHFYHYQ